MEQMPKNRRVSLVCWLLLALLQINTPSSAQNTADPPATTSVLKPKPRAPTSRALPNNVSVAVGEPQPVVYRCEAPEAAQTVTFTLYSNHGNYSLTCPNGLVEDILQGVSGSCEVNNGVIQAVWTLKGASYSKNNTRVFCQQPNYPEAQAAAPPVNNNGGGYAVLIGCALGSFFGVLLVFGLLFLLLRKSERFQNCLGVTDADDDFDSIVKE